ncbi:MAG: hypothetical protein AB8B56_10680 [Crocinitomicaceae bacterium]
MNILFIFLLPISLTTVTAFVCDPNLSNGTVEVRAPSAQSCFEHEDFSNLELDTTRFQGLINTSHCADLNGLIENNELVKELGELSENADFQTVASFLLDIPDEKIQGFCNIYQNNLSPCISDILVPEIIAQFAATSDGCCVDFDALFVDIFGQTITEVVSSLLEIFDSLVCAQRTPGAGISQAQTCGFTLIQGLLSTSSSQFRTNLEALVQIPQGEACNAFTGQEFTNTLGNDMVLMPSSPLGSCSRGIDQLYSFIENTYNALVSSSLNIPNIGEFSRLFETGQCLDIPAEQSESDNDICVHFPTGFAGQCSADFTAASDAGHLSYSYALSLMILITLFF